MAFRYSLNSFIDSLLVIVIVFGISQCQIINQPPRFTPGSGDMARFSLSENTSVDSPVYQLKGKEI